MTKTVDVKTVVSGARNNKQIWRVAGWMALNLTGQRTYEKDKRYLYDKAAELMKKIQLNEFTGDDNHGD